MKHPLLIVALACAISSAAQDSTSSPAAPKFNRVLFGLNASADRCYLTFEDPSDGHAIMAMTPWGDDIQSKFGYTAGLKVQYNFTPHWALGVGAQYADRGYTSERTFSWIMIDPVDPAIPKQVKYRYDHSFIDIPIRLIFQAGQKRIRFTSSLGVAGNVLLTSSLVQTVEYADGHVMRTRRAVGTGYRHVNLSAIGSLGIVHQFTPRSSLQLEPTVQYNLFPIDTDPHKPILWSVGGDVTFYYVLW